MTFERGQENSLQCSAYLVTWFAPNRPVEGATVFVWPMIGTSDGSADEQSGATSFLVRLRR
jgi:hypothetical protein